MAKGSWNKMCTNFKMKTATDGTVVIGRSHEYAVTLPSTLGVTPVGFVGTSVIPEGATSSVNWVATYGVVGISDFGKTEWMIDGMNTAGVSIHGLGMPDGYCVYPEPKKDGTDLSFNEFISFLLGTCGSVAEVKAAAAAVNVWGFDVGVGFVAPMHFLVHDVDASVAIEFNDGVMQITDNPTGVGTNLPFLDWHLTNLNNYVGLHADGHPAVEALGLSLSPLGVGDGLIGLPGDYTSPGRFVRAAAMVALSDVPADSTAAEFQVLHMLNAFDIPTGIVHKKASGEWQNEVTQWVTLCNLTALRYSYRTESDPTVYTIEFSDVDFTAPARNLPISWNSGFVTRKI
jgi:choloylglycine hydrolase